MNVILISTYQDVLHLIKHAIRIENELGLSPSPPLNVYAINERTYII